MYIGFDKSFAGALFNFSETLYSFSNVSLANKIIVETNSSKVVWEVICGGEIRFISTFVFPLVIP